MACGSCGGGSGNVRRVALTPVATPERQMQMPRTMAMADRRAAQAAPLVKPNWSGEARLPVTIRVPVQISNAVYGNGSGIREVHIKNAGQELPTLVITWMQGTPQYRTWFLASTPQPAEVLSEQSLEKNEPADKPIKRGRPKKAALGDE